MSGNESGMDRMNEHTLSLPFFFLILLYFNQFNPCFAECFYALGAGLGVEVERRVWGMKEHLSVRSSLFLREKFKRN